MDTPQPMNPWQPPTGNPVNLAAPSASPTANPGRTRRTGRAVAFVAAGAIGATAITGLAFAANNTPSPTDNGSTAPTVPGQGGQQAPGLGDPNGGPGNGGPDGDGGPGMGHHHGGPGGFGGPGGGFAGRIQHGEAVVTKQDGTTATVRVQTGAITAVSSTEITVKSDDGFEQTWPLSADTKISRDRADAKATDLVVGDKVHVMGEVKSGTVTTLRVGALSAAEAAKLDAQRKAHEQQEQQGQAPIAPNGSSPAAPSPVAPAPSTTG